MHILFLVLILFHNAFGIEWQVITSGNVPFYNSTIHYENNPMLVVGDTLFVATEGGILMKTDNQEKLITVTDDVLSTYRVTSISISENKNLWAACSDKQIFEITPSLNKSTQIDLFSRESEVTIINLLRYYQQQLLVSTNMGLSRLKFSQSIQRWIVSETIRDFGTLGRLPSIYDVEILRDTIWIATNRGISFANWNSTVLQSPISWTSVQGLEGVISYDIQEFNQEIYTSTFQGVYKIRSNQAIQVRSNWSHFLSVWNDELIYLGGSGIRKVFNNELISESRPISFFSASNSHVYAFYPETDSTYGQFAVLRLSSSFDWSPFMSNSPPYFNLFTALRWNNNKIAAIGGGLRTRGLYIYENEEWRFVTKIDHPNLSRFLRQDPRTLKTDHSGNLWLGMGGGGLGIFYSNTDSLQFFDETPETGSHLVPYSFLNEVVVSAIDFLSNGRVVLINDEALDRHPLVVLPQGAGRIAGWENLPWQRLGNTQGLTSFLFNRMTVDPWDRVWLASAINPSQPLTVYDFKNTFDNSSDDIVREFRSNIGLPDAITISSMVVGSDAVLYLATNAGLYYSRITEELTNLRFYPLSIPQSTNQVNTLCKDQLGQLWVGADDGIYLLSSDGQNWVTMIRKSTYPTGLSSDKITFLHFEPNTGELFVTNDGAIAIAKTPYKLSSTENMNIEVSPNPFLIGHNQNMNFGQSGLPVYSEVRIFTPSGFLIKKLSFLDASTQGWNGKNEDGELVASGIYFVVVTTPNGKINKAKVAVIKN